MRTPSQPKEQQQQQLPLLCCKKWDNRFFAGGSSHELFFSPAARLRVQAINPIEMVMEATAMIQKRFYEDYPPHPKEKEYNYKCSSTMKPTQMSVRPRNKCDSRVYVL